jgi:hypothetical protein
MLIYSSLLHFVTRKSFLYTPHPLPKNYCVRIFVLLCFVFNEISSRERGDSELGTSMQQPKSSGCCPSYAKKTSQVRRIALLVTWPKYEPVHEWMLMLIHWKIRAQRIFRIRLPMRILETGVFKWQWERQDQMKQNYYYYLVLLLLLFSLALRPSAGYGLLVPRGFLITHNDAPQSVGLLWTSDQLVAETSIWQHTTDKHPCSLWDSNPRSQQASGRTTTP